MTRPNSRLLRELMKRFPEKLNERTNSSRVLQQAILSDQLAALTFLLENQARVNVIDEFGWTPLICARHVRSDKALRTLEEYMPTVFADSTLAGVIRPTRWDTVFFPENCRLDQDGLTIHYDCESHALHQIETNDNMRLRSTGPANDVGNGEHLYFFADAPFPPCTSSYFEITIVLHFSP
ncbi:hypothetical protein MMC28_002644 [Mycoblastus sanguinarius]|nr:hypothetical protein [Mycoblastus sanguinarius]